MWPQGGGPYGKQVTRGQDLTGKDFSGQTLVKQDFKTVLRLHIWPVFFWLFCPYIFFCYIACLKKSMKASEFLCLA